MQIKVQNAVKTDEDKVTFFRCAVPNVRGQGVVVIPLQMTLLILKTTWTNEAS